jgi:transposase
MLFPHNTSASLSIDETALSNGELYIIVTNKLAKGRKGSIVAMIKGTQAQDIIATLNRLHERLRHQVKAVTLDMAANMQLAIKRSFPKAYRSTDRFHVQKLAYDALQELRIKYRWQALDLENQLISQAKENKWA